MDIKRLSKNVLFLYVRMLILLIVMFYTSRVLLKELGIDDYGLYNVIGGFVLLFSSLKTLFSTAIQRFINYEKVRDELSRIQEIFTIGFYIHAAIAIFFFFLVECVGGWFISHKLVADPDRISTAYWVLHLSVLSSIIMIMTVPYDALIIANEKMNFYAYSSVLDGVLRLIIVFCLVWFDCDKLKLYAVLVFVVSLIMRLVNMIYCKKKFPECKIVRLKDFSLVKKMSTFAAWNFFGNMSYSISHEGINILLNAFGGTNVNAARGIVYQVKNALTTILRNVVVAVDPQGIMLYSEGKKIEFFYLLNLYTRIVVFIYLLMAVPLFFYTNDVIGLWLGQVPMYADVFLRWILLYLFFRALHFPLNLIFKASGELKLYQLCESILLISVLFISYIVLKLGFSVVSVFVIMFVVELINYFCVFLLSKKIEFVSSSSYSKVLRVVFSVFLLIACETYLLRVILDDLNFILQILLQVLIMAISILLVGFSTDEKMKLYRFLVEKVK
ncbi:MAG: polysaccharide biosynthesis protein [Parabacteroides distasonis]|jgi:O-antigen/teichoic acid export membrane protein